MHIIFHLCLIVTLLAISIDCQGARGGGSRGGSSIRTGSRGSSYRTSGGSSCTGDGCTKSGVIIGSIFGGVFSLLAIVFGGMYCYRQWKGQPLRSNPVFVTQPTSNTNETYSQGYFETGIWSSRYCQHNRWHGPHQLYLSFNHTMSRVDGEGTDDIGAFTIDGIFCRQTQKLALTKIYKQGTGNMAENFGHKVTIQLIWNSNQNVFEGKWFIHTTKYRGEDKFELKYHQTTENSSKMTKY
ncbi:unnamed protein product [Adineta steineri]|uniref:Uncharacterized protein n=1 Tax=Adineta steineri TaxID=433720 RepID=A0A814UFQ4_9BILA|nr:unnamed protein product [Adineta steineri]